MSEPEGIIDYIYRLFVQLQRLAGKVDKLSQTVQEIGMAKHQLPVTDEQLDLIAHKVEVALTLKLMDRSQQPEERP
jgi:hypothetical protein